MLGARSAVLLSFFAVGVACTVWLGWGIAREPEPSAVAGERVRGPLDTPAGEPAPLLVSEPGPPGDSRLHPLARWARSPLERTRWRDALRRGGSGLSPFERRLWIGDILEHLSRDLQAGEFEAERAQDLFAELVQAGVLSLERTSLVAQAASSWEDCGKARLSLAIESLVRPARARHAFTLHGRESSALATGRDLRLRVWTPRGQAVPQARVAAALSLLTRLDTVAGVVSPPSIDVLATRAGGKDVFPSLSELPFPFIGVYVPADRLAVIGTRYPPEQYRRLLLHEVIHAWQHAARPGWRATFTMEGLATYGSHFVATDTRFAIPATRMRDDFAWLLHMIALLEGRGVRMERMNLRVLVRARAWDFYSLGWFAYAVAEACFAYLGADTIEAALRSGDEEALLTQCEAIEWAKLLRWMGARGPGGKASQAWFVTESPLTGEAGRSGRSPDPALLAALDLDVPSGHLDDVAALLLNSRPSTRPNRRASPARPRRNERPAAQGHQYITVRNCKKCHFKSYRSWKRSTHARALELLAPDEAIVQKRAAGLDPARDFRLVSKCLRCHTTGHGTPSGYALPREGEQRTREQIRRAKGLAGVGCEACHGPGSHYAPYKKEHEDYKRVDLVKLGAHIPLRAKHCTPCHTPGCPTMPSNFTFDFETARQSKTIHEHYPLKRDHEAGER